LLDTGNWQQTALAESVDHERLLCSTMVFVMPVVALWQAN